MSIGYGLSERLLVFYPNLRKPIASSFVGFVSFVDQNLKMQVTCYKLAAFLQYQPTTTC